MCQIYSGDFDIHFYVYVIPFCDDTWIFQISLNCTLYNELDFRLVM